MRLWKRNLTWVLALLLLVGMQPLWADDRQSGTAVDHDPQLAEVDPRLVESGPRLLEADPRLAEPYSVPTWKSHCDSSISVGQSLNGTWDSGCASVHRGGRYAHYYTFTLGGQTSVEIDLTSSVDTYLFLLEGSSSTGRVLESDDDGGSGRNSRIVYSFNSPSYGTYTIEATTYSSGTLGSFTVSLTGSGGGCSVPLGHVDYCRNCGPCGQGEGDCDSDSECQSGLDCVANVGANYGWSSGTDVCEAPVGGCSVPLGHMDYCRNCGPCGQGEGDCDSDSECQSGLDCVANVGANYGWSSGTDVCEAPVGGCSVPLGHVDYCRNCGPCGQGEGDCDSDSECQSGLVCAENVGADYGWSSGTDVCQNPAPPESNVCLIFVHGSREADDGNDWQNDWLAGRHYWVETIFTSPLDAQEDFIRAATNGFQRNHFVVRYDGSAPYWENDAAGHVAREIARAASGEFDNAAAGGRCDNFGRCRCGANDTLYVVTHSMGGTVMDFILGNSRPSDPNFNHSGPYDVAAASISGVIAVGGAHRGSIAADYICRDDLQGCGIFGHNCTPAREWLQTDDAHQVFQYANAPAKNVFLTGGYQGLGGGGCLPGQDDGVLSFATQYACSGSVYNGYNVTNVCGNGSKVTAGFTNLDTARETHDDERNNQDQIVHRTRRAIPDGVWTCNGQDCAANEVVADNMSSADFIDLLLPDGSSATSPESPSHKNTNSLDLVAAESYLERSRYPSSSGPIEEVKEKSRRGAQAWATLPEWGRQKTHRQQWQRYSDPLLDRLVVWPKISQGPGGEEPSLVAYPSSVIYEGPEPLVVYAHLEEQGKRVAAADVRAVVTRDGEAVAEVYLTDDGTSAEDVPGDLVYSASIDLAGDRSLPPMEGLYSITIYASASTGEDRASRLTVNYSQPKARFTGRHQDMIVDGDLQILSEIKIDQPGRFYVQGSLYSKNGRAVAWAHAAANLPTGLHWIPLRFHGLAFREKEEGGPFVLKYLSLSTTTGMPNSWNRVIEDAYETKAYDVDFFSNDSYDEPMLVESARRLLGSALREQ